MLVSVIATTAPLFGSIVLVPRAKVPANSDTVGEPQTGDNVTIAAGNYDMLEKQLLESH
ncbi:MAG: hypothetical protein WB586_22680 [Chthoniobacterales bacterium]